MFKVNTCKQHTGLAHTDCKYECIGVFPKYLKQSNVIQWIATELWENYTAIISGSTTSILLTFRSLFSASVNEACEIKIFAIRHRGAEILVCEVGGIFAYITASSSGTAWFAEFQDQFYLCWKL